jgi:hypothetical protein
MFPASISDTAAFKASSSMRFLRANLANHLFLKMRIQDLFIRWFIIAYYKEKRKARLSTMSNDTRPTAVGGHAAQICGRKSVTVKRYYVPRAYTGVPERAVVPAVFCVRETVAVGWTRLIASYSRIRASLIAPILKLSNDSS